jgi:membrane protein DedA with SNARE-associated domain
MFKLLSDLSKALIEWYQGALATGGYPLVALLMAVESSILPVPSEAVIPFAAHKAYNTHEISLSLPGIVIAGMIGSWIGASVMYWASRLAGRPLVLHYGRYVLIGADKVEAA